MKRINIPPTILLAVFAAIFITNFPFNAWFTGWDNLHPEFNFPLNFWRSITSVWQTNQGLGTYGGHGYAATLPHTIFLFIMSILIPAMYLRSLFTFFCLLAGGIGVFLLIRKLLSGKDKKNSDIASLLGGVFYMINYATVQNFYIQLEAFIVHFAALPWLFYSLILFLEKKTAKRLIAFSLISLATSTQGFIPPLFIVYLLLLSVFLFFYFIEKPSLSRLKTPIFIMLLTLLINAYWFAPVTYYTFTRSGTYLNAYNNLSSTTDFILKNRKYGDLPNITLLKGFLSETIDARPDGNIFPIFYPWENHISEKLVKSIGYALFALITLGAIAIGKRRKSPYSLFFLVGFLITFTFLATNTPPFSFISNILQNIPVFKQAFRITFTKFSISFAFFCAISLGIGAYALLSFINDKLSSRLKKFPIIVASGLILVSMIYFASPIFGGNFLYQRSKIQIPQMYSDMFNFFNHQDPNTRIANLPQGWNWGWSIYQWGYSGSGFLWYGIEQPILDRSFDVWGKYNESYYWEISYAIFSQKFSLMDSVMEKHQVNWVVLDTNISPYLNPHEYLYKEETKSYLDSNSKYTLVKTFASKNAQGKIYIYKVNLAKPAKNFQKVFDAGELKNIGSSYSFTDADYAFENFGSYYTDNNKAYDIYFPFRSLFTGRKTGELPITIEDKNNNFIFSSKLPKSVNNFPLYVPNPDLYFQEKQPDFSKISDNIRLTFPKLSPQDSYASQSDFYFLNHNATACDTSKPIIGKLRQEIVDQNIVRFTSQNADNCYSIILDRISQRYSYIIQVNSKNVEGNPLNFALINLDSNRADLNYPLPKTTDFNTSYSIMPPMKEFGIGYTVNFQNSSIGNNNIVNDLKSIDIYPIPYNILTQSFFANPNPPKSPKTLVYYQSFDDGWKAYVMPEGQKSKIKNQIYTFLPFIFGKELKTHIMINNWANGWQIPDGQWSMVNGQNIILVYLPQYLEYFGFILLFIAFSLVLIWYKRGTKNFKSESQTKALETPQELTNQPQAGTL